MSSEAEPADAESPPVTKLNPPAAPRIHPVESPASSGRAAEATADEPIQPGLPSLTETMAYWAMTRS